MEKPTSPRVWAVCLGALLILSTPSVTAQDTFSQDVDLDPDQPEGTGDGQRPDGGDRPSAPRSLRLQFQITSPDQLLVAEGDVIQPGQVLVDRAQQRQQLRAQQAQVQLQLSALANEPLRRPPPLPPLQPGLHRQQAQIVTAEAQVRRQERLVQQQRHRLTQLAQLPVPPVVQQHEQARLDQRLEDLAAAELAVSMAIAELAAAEAQYANQVAQFQRQAQIQEISYGEQLSRRTLTIAQLQNQMATLADQLAQAGTTEAQFGGVVRLVRFTRQRNDLLDVELTVVAPATRPSPGATGQR